MNPRTFLSTLLGILIVMCLLLLSCSKGGSGSQGNAPGNRLSPFSVTVIDRAAYTAILKWTAVAPLAAADTVKYAVRLSGRTVDTNLLRLTDTLKHLIPDSAYTGRVYAYTRSGDTVSAPFILDPAVGFIYFGDIYDNVNCVDLYRGGNIWSKNLGGVFGDFGIPVVVNNVLYINEPESGTWAFNSKTGEKIWNSILTIGGQYDATPSPLWANNVLYTARPGGVCALNATTGALLWSTPFTDTSSYPVNPVMAGNTLIAASAAGQSHIVAIDAATGSKIWSDTIKTQVCKNPVVYNSLVIFIGMDGKVYALKTADGSLAWSRDFSVGVDNYGDEFTSPALYHSLLIFYNGNTGYYGLNAADGSTVWNYQTVPAAGSSPAIGGDRVFFTNNNWLVALNAATGSLIWKKAIDPSVNGGAPLCVQNRVYLRYLPLYDNYADGFKAYYAATGDSLDRVSFSNWTAIQETIVKKDTTYYLTESGMLQ